MYCCVFEDNNIHFAPLMFDQIWLLDVVGSSLIETCRTFASRARQHIDTPKNWEPEHWR